MKLSADRPISDPEAARRLMQHARAFEPVQDGRINVEKLNGLFLFEDEGHAGRIFGRSRVALGWLEPDGAACSSASRKSSADLFA